MSKVNNRHIIKNRPLIEDIFDYDVIIIGTGIHNALGNGFQYDIKINFPKVEQMVKSTPYADPRKLGTVSVLNETPIFCVGFIHQGGYRKDINPDYLNYSALEDVIKLVNEYYIYDYEQRDYREINNEKWAKINSLVGKIPYEELRKLKDEYIRIRKYGIHGAKTNKINKDG